MEKNSVQVKKAMILKMYVLLNPAQGRSGFFVLPVGNYLSQQAGALWGRWPQGAIHENKAWSLIRFRRPLYGGDFFFFTCRVRKRR
jgi:hypothetical protein